MTLGVPAPLLSLQSTDSLSQSAPSTNLLDSLLSSTDQQSVEEVSLLSSLSPNSGSQSEFQNILDSTSSGMTSSTGAGVDSGESNPGLESSASGLVSQHDKLGSPSSQGGIAALANSPFSQTNPDQGSPPASGASGTSTGTNTGTNAVTGVTGVGQTGGVSSAGTGTSPVGGTGTGTSPVGGTGPGANQASENSTSGAKADAQTATQTPTGQAATSQTSSGQTATGQAPTGQAATASKSAGVSSSASEDASSAAKVSPKPDIIAEIIAGSGQAGPTKGGAKQVLQGQSLASLDATQAKASGPTSAPITGKESNATVGSNAANLKDPTSTSGNSSVPGQSESVNQTKSEGQANKSVITVESSTIESAKTSGLLGDTNAASTNASTNGASVTSTNASTNGASATSPSGTNGTNATGTLTTPTSTSSSHNLDSIVSQGTQSAGQNSSAVAKPDLTQAHANQSTLDQSIQGVDTSGSKNSPSSFQQAFTSARQETSNEPSITPSSDLLPSSNGLSFQNNFENGSFTSNSGSNQSQFSGHVVGNSESAATQLISEPKVEQSLAQSTQLPTGSASNQPTGVVVPGEFSSLLAGVNSNFGELAGSNTPVIQAGTQMAEQMVSVLAPMTSGPSGSHSIVLQLQPEGLGLIRASVITTATSVSIHLTAQTEAGYDTLNKTLDGLQNLLTNGGGLGASVTLARQEDPKDKNAKSSGKSSDLQSTDSLVSVGATDSTNASQLISSDHNVDIEL